MSEKNQTPGALERLWRGIQSITLWEFLKKATLIGAVIAGLFTTILFILTQLPGRTIPDVEPVSHTVYMDQGWTDKPESNLHQLYYYTPQGATIPQGSTQTALRYDWLVNLEQAWGRERFAEPARMRALGFIVDDAPTPANPDLLPVGFTKHWDDALGENLLDLSCAACHTGQLNVMNNGERIAMRIDGGSATQAIMETSLHQFPLALAGAMTSTYFNPFKFNRFAKKVLANDYKHGKQKLRQNFGATLQALLTQKQNNPLRKLYPVDEGYGRVDAIGRISNTVFGEHLDKDNFTIGNAPVSYPPIWDAWKFNWVQYSASVRQPMARNMGEVLGVGARINLLDPYGRPLPESERFTSSILVENLHRIETTLQQLNPPKWNEALLGTVDMKKAAQGKALFKDLCVSCHGPFKVAEKVKRAESPLKGSKDPEWYIKLLDVEEIGTDPTAADNFVDRRYDMSRTGVKNEQVGALLRPLMVRALRNKVKAEFNSPFLVDFLDARDPRPGELVRDTSWMKNTSWNLDAFEQQFDNWTKTPEGAIERNLTQAIGDPAQIELVRIEITRKALQEIDKHLAGIDISSVSAGEGLNYLGILLRKKYYADNGTSPAKQACLDGFGSMDLPQVLRVYKARPLGGIWATPPFLHNGSVLSIYQLLSPVEERAVEFRVGQNLFDPQNLGFISDEATRGGILFDTTIQGNNNIGHEFREGYIPYKKGVKPAKGIVGPALTQNQRLDIIEYLKIHQDPPTPAGRVIQTCENL